ATPRGRPHVLGMARFVRYIGLRRLWGRGSRRARAVGHGLLPLRRVRPGQWEGEYLVGHPAVRCSRGGAFETREARGGYLPARRGRGPNLHSCRGGIATPTTPMQVPSPPTTTPRGVRAATSWLVPGVRRGAFPCPHSSACPSSGSSACSAWRCVAGSPPSARTWCPPS